MMTKHKNGLSIPNKVSLTSRNQKNISKNLSSKQLRKKFNAPTSQSKIFTKKKWDPT